MERGRWLSASCGQRIILQKSTKRERFETRAREKEESHDKEQLLVSCLLLDVEIFQLWAE